MNKSQSRLIFLAGFLLVAAIGLQCVPKQRAPYFTPPKPLENLVPAVVPGWDVQEREMGETEEVREQVLKILHYDEAFFRTYRQGNTEVGVYVAYWKPGKIDPSDAAIHSPDLCWVNAGWREERHDYAERLNDGTGHPLKIAQFRDFSTAGGTHQEVVFWHLMGGELSGYVLGPSSRWRERLPVLWESQLNNRFGFRQREQFFIRISTNRTISELVADPLWTKIIAGLAPTGILQ
ncbi:MAG: exosortase-associated EpsI family protein [Opitutaceae bacterium]|jgi:hypothetical protein